MWHIWLIIAGVCFIIEIITVGFLVFWFGIGALLSMIISLIFPGNLLLQASVFVVSSTLLIFLTKPFVEKFAKSDKKVVTNAYSIIGKKGIVIQDINPTHGVGQIKIAGEVWSAKTMDGSIIEKGTEVKITKIDGVKAIVEPISATEEIIAEEISTIEIDTEETVAEEASTKEMDTEETVAEEVSTKEMDTEETVAKEVSTEELVTK